MIFNMAEENREVYLFIVCIPTEDRGNELLQIKNGIAKRCYFKTKCKNFSNAIRSNRTNATYGIENVTPLQGCDPFCSLFPGALPQANALRPFGASENEPLD